MLRSCGGLFQWDYWECFHCSVFSCSSEQLFTAEQHWLSSLSVVSSPSSYSGYWPQYTWPWQWHWRTFVTNPLLGYNWPWATSSICRRIFQTTTSHARMKWAPFNKHFRYWKIINLLRGIMAYNLLQTDNFSTENLGRCNLIQLLELVVNNFLILFCQDSQRTVMDIGDWVNKVNSIARQHYREKDLYPALTNLVDASSNTVTLMGDLNNSLNCKPLFRWVYN